MQLWESEFLYNLNEITLARLAIKVPKPPTFTPRRSSFGLAVNPLNKMAAGTLLITWLEKIPARYVEYAEDKTDFK